MEVSSLSLIEDMEDLILDTEKRIGSAIDPYTSGEIKREDVGLCLKNMSELQKIYTEFNTVRRSRKHTVEFWKMFHERVVGFLDVYTEI